MENVVSSATVLWLAFAAAFVFGAIGQKTHFCTMGAVSDIVNMDDMKADGTAATISTKWFGKDIVKK